MCGWNLGTQMDAKGPGISSTERGHLEFGQSVGQYEYTSPRVALKDDRVRDSLRQLRSAN